MTIIAILLATGSAIAWALATVLSKPALRHMDMFSYSLVRPLFALLFVIPYGLLTTGFEYPGLRLLLIAAIAGIIDSFVGSMLFFYALNRAPAHEASSLANTSPFWGLSPPSSSSVNRCSQSCSSQRHSSSWAPCS